MAYRQSIAVRASQAGVTEEEYARNLRAGLEWCSRHRGFVDGEEMSSSIACCSRCKNEQKKRSRQTRL